MTQDDRFLKMLKIEPGIIDDPHAECHRRWLEERDKRERSERMVQSQGRVYSDNMASMETDRNRWRKLAWYWASVGATAIAACLALALRGVR
jgi:hypothetical protein